jgi:ubiquinone/menaquinone biosynthesis C-methylase UbiE
MDDTGEVMDDTSYRSTSAAMWDALAETYDAERDGDAVYDACVRQAVADLRPKGAVLECGCGTGLATGMLLGDADSVHALDFSERMLTQVRQKFPRQHVQTRQADVRKLPYPNHAFDRVLAANVLQHLTPQDQPRAVAELMRILKPGGRYCVTVHHYSVEKQQRGWEKEGKPGQPGIDYIFRYTRQELATLFPGARIRAIGFYGFPHQMLITRAAGHLLARLGRGHMIEAYGTR